MNVVFVDVLTVQNPDGTPGETYRYAVLTVPAKKTGMDATVPMVVTGLSSPPNVPGAYRNYALANATVDRHVHTDSAGKSNIEESWEFNGGGGAAIQLQLHFDSRGCGQEQGRTHAPFGNQAGLLSNLPDRTGRGCSAQHHFRIDRVQKYAFKAAGAKLSLLFDGSEQLISITSLPFYTRQIFLPEEVTQ